MTDLPTRARSPFQRSGRYLIYDAQRRQMVSSGMGVLHLSHERCIGRLLQKVRESEGRSASGVAVEHHFRRLSSGLS